MLRLSEHAAYDRIEVARAARRFPVILAELAAGTVTLTTIRLLAPHLTPENHAALLVEARYRSRREVEQIVVRLHPQPDVPSAVRKLPTPPPVDSAAGRAERASHAPTTAQADKPPQTVASASPPVSPPLVPAPTRPPVVAPLAPARYKVSFTISADTYAKLREAQALLRHAIPDGDLATVVRRRSTISSSAARPTTPTRPNGTLAPGGPRACGKRRPSSVPCP